MAGALVDIGTGTTIAFASSGFTAEVTGVTWDGIERALLDTTHLSSTKPGIDEFGGKTYIVGDLEDPGTITLEMHFNPNQQFPGRVNEMITVSWPLVDGDATAASWQGEGVMQSFSVTAQTEALMTGTMRVKLSGVMTITPAT